MSTLLTTDFNFPGQQSVYHGKVRDVYAIEPDTCLLYTSDSADD